MAETEQPVNVRLFSSNVIVVITGRLEFSFAAKTAAFVSNKSVIVSITIISASSVSYTHLLALSELPLQYAIDDDVSLNALIGFVLIRCGPAQRSTNSP